MAFAAPEPTVSVAVPADPFIGESIDIQLEFDNTGDAAGYGPYIDLVLPALGADNDPSSPDGCTFTDASYLGLPVTRQVFTFPAVDEGVGIGNVAHPYAVDASGDPLIITGTPGDQLVVLQLPFGSFTSGQPPAPVQVSAACSNFANLGEGLPITANGGFQFGADPLDNPADDPSIVGTAVTETVNPTLVTLTKTYLGPGGRDRHRPELPALLPDRRLHRARPDPRQPGHHR